jgi:hypothetical protein
MMNSFDVIPLTGGSLLRSKGMVFQSRDRKEAAKRHHNTSYMIFDYSIILWR